MSDTVIKVQNIGKKYRISGEGRPAYKTIREALAQSAASLFKPSCSTWEDFWALRDVSFEIKRGECVGIIGRNGAGKSTLLKILSRITEPTTGRIELRGRVGSLLEVGTGFHAELTGRENIYLNGTILGMKKKEIDKKFDEIVAFSEIEKFLDTPVKRYSSGMYVRLAFAVAAHLEPEILLVDEVLAVGDIGFQKKCLDRMGSISKNEGRTVLFVSHNLDAVASLCSSAVLIVEGRATVFDDVNRAIDTYAAKNLAVENPVSFENVRAFGDQNGARLLNLGVFDGNGDLCNSFSMWNPMRLKIGVFIENSNMRWQISIAIMDKSQRVVSVLNSEWCGADLNLKAGQNFFWIEIPKIGLFPGTFTLAPMIRQEGIPSTHKVNNAMTFEVKEPFSNGRFFNISKHSTGSQVWIDHRWERIPGDGS